MNSTLSSREATHNLADQAAASADSAIRSTQRLANETLDSMAGSVSDLRKQAAPLLNRATERVSTLAHKGADAVKHSSQQLREQAEHASERTRGYIRDEPMKAVLMAAATGAAVMVLVSLFNRSRDRS